MVKLNILDMSNFLATINNCTGKVRMLCPDGRKININKDKVMQNSLWEEYHQNRDCLKLALEISDPRDYMSIVSYYAGDC